MWEGREGEKSIIGVEDVGDEVIKMRLGNSWLEGGADDVTWLGNNSRGNDFESITNGINRTISQWISYLM